MDRLLVIGGAGYIGSVVAATLLELGHEVVVADDLSTGHRDAVPARAEFVAADVRDRRALEPLMRTGFDAVLHFAARSLVSESVHHPAQYFAANIGGTATLLEAMQRAKVRRLVFSSTAAVYGEPNEVPIRESAPTRPTNPYGASKLASDQLIGFEAAAWGLAAVSLRYFNVAGAAHGCGERHAPESHLIPLVLEAARRGTSVTIHGTDYPTRDGTAVRDYIHVADLATAHVLALRSASAPGHRIFNLGNGAGFSVHQVVDAARRVTRCPIGALEGPRRAGDPAVLIASSDEIRRELGWVPHRPSIETMISDAWSFMTETVWEPTASPHPRHVDGHVATRPV